MKERPPDKLRASTSAMLGFSATISTLINDIAAKKTLKPFQIFRACFLTASSVFLSWRVRAARSGGEQLGLKLLHAAVPSCALPQLVHFPDLNMDSDDEGELSQTL